MTDNLQTYIEPELEARIVALVLGEASAFEAEELERLMSEKPELRAYRTGLEKIHGVMAEAHEDLDDSEWKLSEGRRGKILTKIEERKRHEMVEVRRKRISRIAQRRLIYTCAACLVLTLIILVLSQPIGSEKISPPMLAYSESAQKAEEVDLKGSSSYSMNLGNESQGLVVSSESRNAPENNKQAHWGSAESPKDLNTLRNIEDGKQKKKVADAMASLDESLMFDIPQVEQGTDELSSLEKKLGEVSDRRRVAKSRSISTLDAKRKPSAPSAASSAVGGVIVANSTAPSEIPVPELAIPDPVADFGDGDDFGAVPSEGEVSSGGVIAGFTNAGNRAERPGSVALGNALGAPDLTGEEASWDFELTDTNGRVAGESVDPFEFEEEESEEVARETLARGRSGVVSAGEQSSAAGKKELAKTSEERGQSKSGQDKFFVEDNEKLPATPEPGARVSRFTVAETEALKEPGLKSIVTQNSRKGLNFDGIIAPNDGANPEGLVSPARGLQIASDKSEVSGIALPIQPIALGEADSPEESLKEDADGDGFAGGGDLLRQEMMVGDGDVERSNEFLMDARQDYSNGEYESAVKKYRGIRGNFFEYEPSDTDPFSDNGGDPDPFVSGDENGDGLGGRRTERDRSLEMDIQSARAVPRYGGPTPGDLQVKEQIDQLNEVIIPEVDFEDTTVAEAVKFLERKTREVNPEKGVDIRVRTPKTILPDGEEGFGEPLDSSKIRIKDLQLSNVPARVALQHVADAARLRYKVDGGGVTLLPVTDGGDSEIVQNRWDLSPEVSNDLREATADGKSIVTVLKEQGIPFSQNASASFLDDENMLIIRNSPTNMELVDGLVTAAESFAKAKARTREAEWLLGEAKVQAIEKKGVEAELPKELPSVKKKSETTAPFETSTKEKIDSTFSLNVSDVSFKLAKAALSKGNWPDTSKIRPEEFVNALSYGDIKPTQAEKISCEIEQGSHPFMQQRNLMRVSMSTASLGRNAATPLRLTILLDQSGSMERADRAESVQKAFALLAAQLNPNDEVTLVGFARTPRLLAERVKGDDVAKLAEFVANPLTEGGTNLEEALSTGLQLAKQQFVKGAQNRIILLTDGAANLGDAKPVNLASQVESMRQADIAFDACGVGADGLNDDVLSSLTKQGDGRYYFLDRPEDADDGFARQIAGALRPAAKNVKVQVLFNPERVSTFKLYGFEKHKLKKEDFRNDSVDAAEMAAEESGVALYHFEPLPEGRGDIGTVSVRFLDTASNQMVERTWSIPYQEEADFFSKADPKLRLASVAALFAERLKGSPVGDRVELKRLRQETQLLKPAFSRQTRFNEFQTMLQQAGD